MEVRQNGETELMPLSIILIILGIVIAVLVNYAIGILMIVIGLVLMLWPRLSAGGRGRTRGGTV
jgi:hypothetical protein